MVEVKIEEEDREWLAAVGLMTVYWADLEIMMDTYIAVLISHPDSTLIDRPIDTQTALDITFNKRIRLWKDTIAELPLDQTTKTQSLELAERARDARNHRDILVHGMTRRRPDGTMVANHLPRKKGQKVQHIPYPPEKILKIAGEIIGVQADIILLMTRMMALIVETSEKRRGE
jgi:hypothetical protein